MKYVSIDIETTGLNPETCEILSIGAIVEDTNKKLSFDEIPKFHCAIKKASRDIVSGEIYALNMNRDLIEKIVYYSTAEDLDEKNDLVQMTGMYFLERDRVVRELYSFLYKNGLTPKKCPSVEKMIEEGNSELIENVIDIAFDKGDSIIFTPAGKNFSSFDINFLKKLPNWSSHFKPRNRVIDPGILMVDWEKDDCLPSLDECKKRAKLEGGITHDALEDAWDVIQILRIKY